MTNEKAIEIIKGLNFWATGETKQANVLAIEALSKQIANSRDIINGKYYCSTCGKSAPKAGYCKCGQKLY